MAAKIFIEKLKGKDDKEATEYDPSYEVVQKTVELYKKIDILNGIERSNIDNKIIDLAEKIPEKDKKILDKVFNIIENEYCYEDKKKFVRTILSNY